LVARKNRAIRRLILILIGNAPIDKRYSPTSGRQKQLKQQQLK